ncbi:MAG: nucleotide sugar dehydrogenase [Flavobacteriaceae bacterium]|nr:nucleotide sugar dehydrogenase [Flavobacteriaceae bacterium]
MKKDKQNAKITIIGLGYIGVPLAIEFAKKYSVTGFDISQNRINQLLEGEGVTCEVETEIISQVLRKSKKELDDSASGFFPTNDLENIKDSMVYIVTVPTPVDKANNPDLRPLLSASKTIGQVIKKGDVVIYESTTYPGCTEEDCIPVIEEVSGLKFNEDFFAGYSPERINPGDKVHTITKIKKVTSGSTPEIADFVNDLYASIITAGTFKAGSIKVAEAAKVIENSQRDINIAFVNELSKIFNCMGIDTTEVLEAAATKWNFLNFKPGLVGGHCIGVDPYYLAQKAVQYGYHPEIILAGRRLNDTMSYYVASEVVKLMVKKEISIKNSNILVLGFTFKENCPDVRNTKVLDIIHALKEYEVNLTCYDPNVNPDEVKREYGIEITNTAPAEKFDALILAVAHDEFKTFDFKNYVKETSVIYDCKSFLDRNLIDKRL